MIAIGGERALANFPDGTLITWLRIPGDETSRAVAFVHTEWPDPGPDTEPVIWISPGGWNPMSPTEAGINYPAFALVLGPLGDFIDAADGVRELDLGELVSGVVEHGGTWAREKALECASRAWAGMGSVRNRDATMLETADKFEAWLDRPVPE